MKSKKPKSKYIKRTLGSKILVSYLLLLVITFGVSLVVYNRVSESYLVNKAVESMEEDVQAITRIIKAGEKIKQTRDINNVASTIAQARLTNDIRMAGRFFDSKIVILTSKGRIAYTSDPEITYEKIMEVATIAAKDSSEYIFRREQFKFNGTDRASIIVYTAVEDVVSMRKLGFSVFTLSFSIGGVLALLISLFFQKLIGRPIKKLSNAMREYSFNDPVQQFDIHTGDEIEELADTFTMMSTKIQTYHGQQKVFFQNASHELKTPLMSIQGYAEAIKDGIVEDDEKDESLDIIIGESQRLKKIVEEMILLTKLEDEQEPFDFRATSVDEIIKGSLRSLNSLFAMHEVEIKFEMNSQGQGLYDVDKLTRGFINILGNCARYAKSEVVVKTESISDVFYVEIRDDGAGFKDGEAERVFERFYKGQGGGSGIGLALTKTIIERHGGEVWAENVSTGGAVFKMKFKQRIGV